MKNTIKLLLCCLCFIVLTNCKNKEKETADYGAVSASVEELSLEDSIKRGNYLVNIMDCNVCHSPKIMSDQGPIIDESRMLSGHPADAQLPEINPNEITPDKWVMTTQDLTVWVGLWGVSFTANLTSDETGIGTWSLDQFKRAIREGKFKGMENGRTLLPPMPWQTYSYLTDEDVKAIYDYLKSIPPIRNIVPAPIPPTEIQ